MMNFKKTIMINISFTILLLMLFVIWHRNSIGKVVQTTSLQNYTVYLITTERGYEYWETLNQGAADMAALLGVGYVWEAPIERNTYEQIGLINRALERGANALIVAADDPVRVSSVIEDAKARSIPVIYVDTPAYEEALTTLATDNYKAGVIAGQTMLSILDRMGITSGSIGIVNLTLKANTELREMGFREALAQDTRYHVLETMYVESDNPEITQEAAERIINDNQDLVALYATTEGTTMGIGYAIQANDNRYVGVGYDKTIIMTQLLQDGSLKAVLDQNPYTMGYLGMAQAVAAILGKDTGPEYIDTGITVVEMK